MIIFQSLDILYDSNMFENTESYKRALADGERNVPYARVMLLGTAGVGKTTFKRSLMKLPFECDTTSTGLSDIYRIRPFGHEWKTLKDDQWKVATYEDELEEMAHLLSSIYKDNLGAHNPSDAIEASLLYDTTSAQLSLDVPEDQIEEMEERKVNKILSEAIDLVNSQTATNTDAQPFLHIWDCGGQPAFLELLPPFLTPRTLFVLMFDASRGLNERWRSVLNKDGHEKFLEEVNMTTLELMLSWMANIHGHLAKGNQGKSFPGYPRILCIGTRGDRLESEEQRSAIKSELESHIKGKAFRELIEDVFIVDNTTSGFLAFEDRNLADIRRIISNFTYEKLIVKTPVSWVLFRKVIQALEENVVSLEEAHIIARACKISPDDVPKVLLFYHDLGALLFYPHIKGLHNKVVVSPKYFVDVIGKLFTVDRCNVKFDVMDMWEKFQENGILIEPLYKSIWEQSDDFHPDALIDLLVDFRIAAEFRTSIHHDPNVKQYFVPAILKSFPGDPYKVFPDSYMHASPLHIIFSIGFVPPGFFTRFVTTIASNPTYKLCFDHGVYRNHVTFRCDDSFVAFTDLQNAILVDVVSYDRNNSIMPFAEFCQNLKMFIEKSAKAVEITLSGSQATFTEETSYHITFEFKYVCQSDKCAHQLDQLDHQHYVQTSSEQTSSKLVYCEKSEEKLPYRSLSAEEAYWFKDDMTIQKVHHRSRYCFIYDNFVLRKHSISFLITRFRSTLS